MSPDPDENGGTQVTWNTNTEQGTGNGTDETTTYERSLPQENSKNTETGDHKFYDPRNQRSGVAGGSRNDDSQLGGVYTPPFFMDYNLNMKEEIEIDKTLTPENAVERDLEWVKDIIVDREAPDVANQEIVELIKAGNLLGMPAGSNSENNVFGLYRKIGQCSK